MVLRFRVGGTLIFILSFFLLFDGMLVWRQWKNKCFMTDRYDMYQSTLS